MAKPETFSDALRECMQELGGVRTKAEISQWIEYRYPGRWKNGTLVGHLYGCCVNNPKGIQHHPTFPRFLYAHGNSRYELYDVGRHGSYENGVPAGEEVRALGLESEDIVEASRGESSAAFAYEAHLRDYLARNLEILEKGLQLWNPSTDDSVEYALEGRRIDILTRDTSGVPVIVELKVNRGHEKTVGQCLFYRAKLKQLLAIQRVRIFIVAEEISPELRLAAQEVPEVSLFEYRLSMTVKQC